LTLGILFYQRNKVFKNRKRKWFWISLTIFFIVYFIILSGATYSNISSKLELQKYDLNGDKFFNGDEITSKQEAAMNKVINDTGRNFSFITGIFFSGIIAFFVYLIGRMNEYLKK
tara:strand:+ start:58407 stop:58751 length:345 start_codon:yes stop_codon:yes gene_type:complete